MKPEDQRFTAGPSSGRKTGHDDLQPVIPQGVAVFRPETGRKSGNL
jgi:hypothetical protein